MSNHDPSYRLLQDVVIPAGTKFSRAPYERGGRANIEAVVGLGKDCTAYLNLPVAAVEDAEEWLVKD